MLEAPPFGDHVRLSIGDRNNRFALNYQSPDGGGAEWPLLLSRSISNPELEAQTVSLSFIREPAFPDDFELLLVDEDYQFARAVTGESTLIPWDNQFKERRLRLIAGSAAYTQNILTDIPLAPEVFELDQNYPNPFQRTTSIRYQLAERSPVSLTIYNALGQHIQTLVNTPQNPGVFEVVWDGRDASGQFAPSGLYLYRLTAGKKVATGRMALIR